jgi:hypothetical protein
MGRKRLSNLSWVALAAATEHIKPALTGIHATTAAEEGYPFGYIEATDGKRFHRAPNDADLKDGIWSASTDQEPMPVDDVYPNIQASVLNVRPPTDKGIHLYITDVAPVIAVCKAGAAGNVSLGLRGPEGGQAGFVVAIPHGKKKFTHVNPLYLGTMLVGATAEGGVTLHQLDPLAPLFVDLGLGRMAVVMPIRVGTGVWATEVWRILSLDGLVDPLIAPDPVEETDAAIQAGVLDMATT